jgi:hypothetical protein
MQITHLGILNSDAFIVKGESLEYHFLAPSEILHEKELEMRACSVFLNILSFDSKSTSEYCIKLRND